MKATPIDMTAYPRKAHFDYFRSLAYPYVGVTAEVDITDFRHATKAKGYNFFHSFLWCVSQVANAIPEFRYRQRGDHVVEYDFCMTSHTVAREDETYVYCDLNADCDYFDFLPYARAEQEKAKISGDIDRTPEEEEGLLFISTMTWLTHTALIQPVPSPADSNPRITWGKFFDHDGKIKMPVSLLVNHALADGRHIALFYKLLDEKMAEVVEKLGAKK